MPKSKHRKNHKVKVAQYKKDIKVAEKRMKQQRMQDFIEKYNKHFDNREVFETGEVLENTDIQVDLDAVDTSNTESI